MRPQSIVRFQWTYLAFIIVTAIATAVGWGKVRTALETTADTSGMNVDTLVTYSIATTAIGYIISFLLWWLICWRRNAVSKWIVVAFFALLHVATTIFALVMGRFEFDAPNLISLVGLALNAVAVWFLFQPDADIWFSSEPLPEPAAAPPIE